LLAHDLTMAAGATAAVEAQLEREASAMQKLNNGTCARVRASLLVLTLRAHAPGPDLGTAVDSRQQYEAQLQENTLVKQARRAAPPHLALARARWCAS
jgi:hypothetical protein